MKASYNLPRMTADQRLCLEPCHARRLPRHPSGGETVSEFVARTLELVKTHELCEWSSITVYEPMEEWEAAYLADLNQERMAKLTETRKALVGCTLISVNFVTLSHAVRFYTKDPAIIAEWRAALEANPGWPACAAYHKKLDESLAQTRVHIEHCLAVRKERENANA